MTETPIDTGPAPINMPAKASDLYRLVQDRMQTLGLGDLKAYIAVRREPTPPMPYYQIARDISELTKINITHEAARRWHLGLTKRRPAPVADAA